MQPISAIFFRTRPLLLTAYCALAFCAGIQAQSSAQTPRQPDDVVRINTEFVQTDMMVFDRRGHFVDGVRPDEIVLTLGGAKRAKSDFQSNEKRLRHGAKGIS
jgi:hypothetical protein